MERLSNCPGAELVKESWGSDPMGPPCFALESMQSRVVEHS